MVHVHGVAHRPGVFTSTFLGKNLLTYIHTYTYITFIYPQIYSVTLKN